MKEENLVDDLVALLDNSVNKGVGHINVETDTNQHEVKKVETLGCIDCAKGDLACKIPNLHEGVEE